MRQRRPLLSRRGWVCSLMGLQVHAFDSLHTSVLVPDICLAQYCRMFKTESWEHTLMIMSSERDY